MASDVKLGATGLNTADNPFSDTPKASLIVADEVVIRSDGVLEPRRGLGTPVYGFGGSNTRARAGVAWRATRLVVVKDPASPNWFLTRDTGSAWLAYTTPYNPPDVLMARTRFAESARRLFFTTLLGPFVLESLPEVIASSSARGNPRRAGLPRPIEFTGFPDGNSSTNVLPPGRSRAYRIVFGMRDENDVVILGPVSGRVLVTNVAAFTLAVATFTRTAGNLVTVQTTVPHGLAVGQVVVISPGEANFPAGPKAITVVTETTFRYVEVGANVTSTIAQTVTPATGNPKLTIPLPPGISTQHFIQVYASRVSQADGADPGDEEFQVYEASPTATEIAAGELIITDIAPDSLLGPPLYTNANQEGILQSNDRPPLARDMAEFAGSLVYARVTEPQRLEVTLLGIGPPLGLQLGDQLLFRGLTESNGISANTSEGGPSFQLFTAGSPSQNVERTARSIVRTFNRTFFNYKMYYISGPNDPPGRLLVEAVDLAALTLEMQLANANRRSAWYPPPRYLFGVVSVIRTGGNLVTVTTVTPHGLIVGDLVDISTSDPINFPSGIKTVTTVPTTTTFTYAEAGANVTATGSTSGLTVGPPLETTAEVMPNGMAVSKFEEPEAVPVVNRLRGSHDDDELLRIHRLGRTLFLFYERGGLWRMTGADGQFIVEESDPNVRLYSPDAIARVGQVLFAWTERGLIPITENGAGLPITDPVWNQQQLTFVNPALRTTSWAAGYEGEGELYLGLVGDADDPDPANIWVYSLKSRAWLRWKKGAHFALVDPVNGLLYMSPTDDNVLLAESKTFTAEDYKDERGAVDAPLLFRVQWQVYAGSGPSRLKNWQAVTVLFGQAEFTLATLTFTSDVNETESTVILTGFGADATVQGPRAITASVPSEHAVSTILNVGLAINVNRDRVQLRGAVLEYEDVGEGPGQ